MADAYIEVASEQDVHKAVSSYKHPPIKGRKVFIVPSSQDQMLADLFPGWPGHFVHGAPVLDSEGSSGSIVDNEEATFSPPPPLIQRQEFESLLQICRNFKVTKIKKRAEKEQVAHISHVGAFLSQVRRATFREFHITSG